MALTIFFDGRCSLCVKEMRMLAKRDTQQHLQFEDVWQDDFSERYPHIDPTEANRILHAQNEAGDIVLGLDVTAQAWSLVGVKRYKILRWPLIKPIADFCYRRFANNRYWISSWFGGSDCESGTCQISSKHAHIHNDTHNPNNTP